VMRGGQPASWQRPHIRSPAAEAVNPITIAINLHG
jgi:hypothetical protein